MFKELPVTWKVLDFKDCISSIRIPKNFKIPEKEYKTKGKTPIIDQGKEYIVGYSDNEECFTDFPAIIFGDHTRRFKYVDFPFLVGADGTKVLIPNRELLNTKYLYYYLKNLNIEDHGYQRHYKFLKEKQIIIPPIEYQNKIISEIYKIERIKEYQRKSEDLINYTFNATLNKALKGEIKC